MFRVLADPKTHGDIDGTGWVREPLDDGRELTEVGQIFRIAMYHDNHPDKHYEMANQVTVLEPDRAIGWAPGGDCRRTAGSSSAAGRGVMTSSPSATGRPSSP